MRSNCFFLILSSVFISLFVVGNSELAKSTDNEDWWKTASFYQIYPRSWKDSNGDGVGDLNGITQNLDYLKEIGITATWLSPIFTSPMADFGYDISNFTEIDPIFGTMEDFDALIAKANSIGIKIILDFVPNHSSDECEWFKRSVKRDPKYEDFYVWAPGYVDNNGVRYPPSNWVSVFRGSAWEWNDERGEYYLHQFDKKQPDLNYRNPKVRETMENVLRFWLKKGAAGFRIDAVQHVFEVPPTSDGNFWDEPRNDNDNDPNSYGYTSHIFTVDQTETTEMIYDWRAVMDEFQKENGSDSRILMAESYSPYEVVMGYYGNNEFNGAQIPFNFLMLQWLSGSSNAYNYADAINTWLFNMPKGRTANWVIGNHDKNRVGSRLGTDRIDMINMLILTLPGASITYQGEEIGMTDVYIPWSETIDPQACNTNPDIYQYFSRDPARTPFQWNTDKNAGFSTADTTWLPVSDLYPIVNVVTENNNPRSHLSLYKQLQNLRREQTLMYGDAKVDSLNQNILSVKRSLSDNYTYITLLNIWNEFEFIDLTTFYPELQAAEMEYHIVNLRSQHQSGDSVSPHSILMMPKEAVILRTKTKM